MEASGENDKIVFADLHLHSHYSRATSSLMDLHNLARYARIKGLGILGTGDFTHPRWLAELRRGLKDDGSGLYEYEGVRWVLQAEISLIYTQGGRQRRVHHVLLAPDFEVVDQINEWLAKRGRMDYDGRPIFGFSSIDLAEAMMGISQNTMIIPAHAWTPWYAIFGSKSGFDSVEECFGEKAKHIFAIETGLSSDPAMNWRISKLDRYSLVSNSDSHSPQPWRIGREANAFSLREPSYGNLIDAIRTKKGFMFTIETPPEYGKYHLDGHRACNICFEPSETAQNKGLCPACGKPLTIGVLNRIEELADRKAGATPENAVPFKSLIPLHELIGAVMHAGVSAKKTGEIYDQLIAAFGNEFNVLLNARAEELNRAVSEKLVRAIMRNRAGKIKIRPGYDGEYGVPTIDSDNESGLMDFL